MLNSKSRPEEIKFSSYVMTGGAFVVGEAQGTITVWGSKTHEPLLKLKVRNYNFINCYATFANTDSLFSGRFYTVRIVGI